MTRQPTAHSLGQMMYENHMDAGGWALSIFVSLLLVALVVLAIVWLIRSQSAGASASHRGNAGASPRELLDLRLASGEIDEGEYQRLCKAIAEAPGCARPPTSRRTCSSRLESHRIV
jgi:uncharacterized membrane protein